MKIVRTERTWIHTRFVTDGVYLPADRAREIQRGMVRVLEENRIVFGIHYEARSEEAGLSIVLECIPLPEAMQNIEAALAGLLAPIPARPRKTEVEIAPPERRAIGKRR